MLPEKLLEIANKANQFANSIIGITVTKLDSNTLTDEEYHKVRQRIEDADKVLGGVMDNRSKVEPDSIKYIESRSLDAIWITKDIH